MKEEAKFEDEEEEERTTFPGTFFGGVDCSLLLFQDLLKRGDSESDALSQASSSAHSEEVPKEERCGLRPMWGLAGGGRADILWVWHTAEDLTSRIFSRICSQPGHSISLSWDLIGIKIFA